MITLQPLTPDAIPALQHLAHVIWHQVFAHIITREQTDLMLSRMYDPARVLKEMASGVVWKILHDDQTPIGYVSYSMTGPDECQLHKIYVHPDHHGRGLGRQLMEDAVAYARAHQARTIYLRVNRANAKALRAYRAFGFREAESIDWEFAPGFTLHDYRMELPLA